MSPVTSSAGLVHSQACLRRKPVIYESVQPEADMTIRILNECAVQPHKEMPHSKGKFQTDAVTRPPMNRTCSGDGSSFQIGEPRRVRAPNSICAMSQCP